MMLLRQFERALSRREQPEMFERIGDLGVFGPMNVLANAQRSFEERASLRVAAQLVVDVTDAIEDRGFDFRLALERLVDPLHGVADGVDDGYFFAGALEGTGCTEHLLQEAVDRFRLVALAPRFLELAHAIDAEAGDERQEDGRDGQ